MSLRFARALRRTLPQLATARRARAAMSTVAARDRRPIKAEREQAFAAHNIDAYPRFSKAPAAFPATQVGAAAERARAGATDQVTVHGRISSKRTAGKKLTFLDVSQDGAKIQVVASEARVGEPLRQAVKTLHSGDVVRVCGTLGLSQSGEPSVYATRAPTLLAPCLHSIPARLTDAETRFRNRHLDLLVNRAAVQNLRLRSRVVAFVRRFLEQRQFVEVETPVISPTFGGASARPFRTSSSALGAQHVDLFLRVAPELYLKQLVVGGLDRVFEIGKQFRNEGIDADHNPEFTTCEFYMAYADLDDLFETTETMLRGMVCDILGAPAVEVPAGPRIDFARPFARIDVLRFLRARVPDLPPSFDDPAAVDALRGILERLGVRVRLPHTAARLLDKLIGHLIEPECVQPTFLYGHPAVMSPLSKPADGAGLTSARFELFVNGKEIVNAYEELNDPNLQRARFAAQAADRAAGDDEVPEFDAAFCDALEFGLPPTAGWGMGIDRVVALVAQARNLREVIAFPVMKPSPK